MYNAKLANNLGNLVNRVVVLALKLNSSLSQSFLQRKKEENNNFIKSINNYFQEYNLKSVLDDSFKFLDTLNDFTTKKEPWKMIKDETKQQETKEVLYTIAE